MPASLRQEHAPAIVPITLGGLWWMFLRIACTSFGGYMAMISVLQHTVVQRRKLMSGHDVLDGISLASALPGPIAVNVVVYVGYRLRGVPGAVVCLCAAVLPAFMLMLALSAAYFRWGHVPAVSKVFMGVMPVVAAVLMASARNLSHKALVGSRDAMIAIAAAAAVLGLNGIYVTFLIVSCSGLLSWLLYRRPAPAGATEISEPVVAAKRDITPDANSGKSDIRSNLLALAGSPQLFTPFMSVDPNILLKLFFTFAWMSMFLFGGAYVFVPLLQQSVVNEYSWVTQREFADAVAMAQLMPGPAVVSVVFVGFKTAGLAGATAATAGIFLPSAALMMFCTRLLDRIKTSASIEAALRGVRAAVVGMIFSAAILIGRTAPAGWISITLFLIALVVLLRYRIDAVWLVPPAGLLGFLIY